MDNPFDFSLDFDKIEEFLDKSHYEEAIERSFKILEKTIKFLYNQGFTKLKLETQIEFLNDLKDNYSGKKFNDLTIGEKLKLFDEYKFLSYLDISLDKEVNPKTLLKLNTLRVDSTHQKKEISRGDAYYSYSVILRFLEKIRYSSLLTPEKSEEIKSGIKKSSTIDTFIPENLPARDYAEFIGREKEIQYISNLLLHEKVHVLSIDGIGGVGKSSLALEVGYKLKKDKIFDAIIWVTAKQSRLTYKGIEEMEYTLGNLEDLFNEILKVFDAEDLLKLGSIETKERKVLDILKENHCLLIVDNLETIKDENLKNFLIDLRFPIESKVLITSRKRLGQVEYVVYLEKFALEDTRKYVNSQLNARDFKRSCSENLINDIHIKTGGIPLAIKVLIPWIIEGKVKDKIIIDIDKETDILNFCFDKVFNEFLSFDAQRLFCILSIAPTEISEAALRFISGLDDENYNQALGALITYSLISIAVKEKLEEHFYMLPLTQDFGKREAEKKFPDLKEYINKSYLRFLELSKSEKESAKRVMAINKAEEAKRLSSHGDIEKATQLFKESIGYDSKCDYALYLFAIFCREKQDFGQGRTLIEKAIKINENNPFYWSEYATNLELYGDYKKAERVLEKALIKTKNDRHLLLKYVLIKSKLQKNEDVIKIARENIIEKYQEKKDKFINTLLTVSLLEGHWRKASNSIKSGRHDEATKILLKGLSEFTYFSQKKLIFPYNGKLLWEIKKTYHKLGDLSEILRDNKKAKEFYKKSIYEVALFEDRKKHNRIILKKLSKI